MDTKTKTTNQLQAPLTPVRLERAAEQQAPERPPDKRIVIIHDFQWHRIISALAFLILVLAAVAQNWR